MRVHYDGPSGVFETTWPAGSPVGEQVVVTRGHATITYKLAGVQDGIAFYVEERATA